MNNKLTGIRIGELAIIDSSGMMYTGSLGAPRSRPPHYRTSLEASISQRLATGGSVELDGQKESSGVSDAPYGRDGPPIKEERNARSRDDGTERPSFDDGEADSNLKNSINRNSLSRHEALKRPAEWVFGPADSTRLQTRAYRRGNGGESKKKKEMSYGDENAIQSSQPSTKVVPQEDSKKCDLGF